MEIMKWIKDNLAHLLKQQRWLNIDKTKYSKNVFESSGKKSKIEIELSSRVIIFLSDFVHTVHVAKVKRSCCTHEVMSNRK